QDPSEERAHRPPRPRAATRSPGSARRHARPLARGTPQRVGGMYALPDCVWRLGGQTVGASSEVCPFFVNSRSWSGGSAYWCQSQPGLSFGTGFCELYVKTYRPCVPTSEVCSSAPTIPLASAF